MLITYDIETDGLLDTMTKMHCLVAIDEQHRLYIFVARENIRRIKAMYPSAYVLTFDKIADLLKKGTELVCHNQLGFDLHVLENLFNFKYHVDPCHINNNPIEIIDTLCESRWLYPDRPLPPGCPEYIKDYKEKTGRSEKIGPHGLKAWSFAVGGNKPAIEKWEGLPIEDYVYRCVEDVKNNVKVFHALMDEMGEMFNCKTLHWREIRKKANFVIEYERFHMWEMDAQQHRGVNFNIEKANELVERLDKEMSDLLEQWYDKLPVMPIPLGRAKADFGIPKIRFKKSGELSSNMEKFIAETGAVINEDKSLTIPDEGTFPWPWPETYRTTEKITFNSKKITTYLMEEFGWEPTFWNYKKDPKTNKPMKDENRQLIPLSPAIKDAATKTICPNLLLLDAPFVKALVLYRTLQHRRTTIASTKGTEKGYLNHPRLQVDGRLPAILVPCGTNTRRGRHIGVCNVPKAEDDVLYGKELRSLFYADDGDYFLGYDCAGIEARLEAAACFKYDKGQYLELIMAGDIHQYTADMLSTEDRKISRSKAKNIRYASAYGAGVGKIAKMLGCSFEEARLFLEEWWQLNWATKSVIDKLIEEYEASDRGSITAFDGSKLFIRSPHAALNTYLQNGGTTILKISSLLLYRKIKDIVDAGLAKKVIDYHDECQFSVNKKLVKFKRVHSDDEAKEYKKNGWSKMITTNNNKFVAYCEVGDYAIKSIAEAGKLLKLDVPLSGDYLIGHDWSECH